MKQSGQNFEDLRGKVILQWIGTELAINQVPPVVWTDESINYLQLFDLDILFSDNSVKQLVSQLDDDCNYYGLYLEHIDKPLDMFNPEKDSDVLRRRHFSELPVGVIDRVECTLGAYEQITTLTIYVANSVVKLISGAIEPTDDYLKVVTPEEFVLIEREEV